jgi:hypothetical protein
MILFLRKENPITWCGWCSRVLIICGHGFYYNDCLIRHRWMFPWRDWSGLQVNLFYGLNGSIRSWQEFEFTHNWTLLMYQRLSYFVTKIPASNHILFTLDMGQKRLKLITKKSFAYLCDLQTNCRWKNVLSFSVLRYLLCQVRLWAVKLWNLTKYHVFRWYLW